VYRCTRLHLPVGAHECYTITPGLSLSRTGIQHQCFDTYPPARLWTMCLWRLPSTHLTSDATSGRLAAVTSYPLTRTTWSPTRRPAVSAGVSWSIRLTTMSLLSPAAIVKPKLTLWGLISVNYNAQQTPLGVLSSLTSNTHFWHFFMYNRMLLLILQLPIPSYRHYDNSYVKITKCNIKFSSSSDRQPPVF